MSAIFSTVIAVLLDLLFEEYYAESALPEGSLQLLLLALPLCLLPLIVAELAFKLACRRFNEGRPIDVRRVAGVVMALPLVVFAVLVFGFRWPTIVVPLRVEATFLIDDVLVLLPFFVSLVVAMVEAARLRRPLQPLADGPRPVSPQEVRGVVTDQLRHLFLCLIPLFAMLLLWDLANDTGLNLYFEHLPILSAATLILLLGVLLVVYPQLFRIGMGLRPLLPDAPLRRKLEKLAERLDFTCRDILYWPMRRPVLNAAIVGVLPRFRYVILTEELCRRLTLDELSAVFVHEVGHGKKHHASFYLLSSLVFMVAVLPLGSFVGDLVSERTHGGIDATLAATLLVFAPGFALYWAVVFSFVSRRFELEADVYGVEKTGDAASFIDTLEKVARISRIERAAKARRHFSIEGRTDFLRSAFLDGRIELLSTFRAKLRNIRRIITIAAAVVVLFAIAGLSLVSARGTGAILIQRGDPDGAVHVLDLVLRLRPGDQIALALRAEAGQYTADPSERSGFDPFAPLLERAGQLTRSQRTGVLNSLRSGFARALALDRPEVARRLIDVAAIVNGDGNGDVFDRRLQRDLRSMQEVADAVTRNDVAAVEERMDALPRWLRRPDAHAARVFLDDWVESHK